MIVEFTDDEKQFLYEIFVDIANEYIRTKEDREWFQHGSKEDAINFMGILRKIDPETAEFFDKNIP